MNTELNKKNKSFIAAWAIAAVIFILAFAIIPFPKNSASVWIAFVFTLVSLAASLFTTFKAFGKDGAIVSKLYGYPIFKVGVLYAVFQIALSIVVFAISVFVKVPYWITLLLSAAFLGLAAIGFIAADNAKDIVEKADEDLKASTKTVEMFRIDMDGVLDLCPDSGIKTELKGLAENLRYSDPVSSDATKELEITISDGIFELREMVANGNDEKTGAKIKEIQNLLNERNRICKINKR